jgi:hypothetical protein
MGGWDLGNFVKCSDGIWLNLDSIAKIVPIKEGGRSYKFLTPTGEVAGESLDFDPASLMPVLPALPGEALFEFYANSTERRPVDFTDIVTIEMPILGWRCGDYRAQPVTYRPYLDRGASMYLYRLADGRFKDEWGNQPSFENFETAKAHVLRSIQSKWN